MKYILLIIVALFSANVLSHPGHDHTLWFLEPFHVSILLFIISAFTIFFIVARAKKAEKYEDDK